MKKLSYYFGLLALISLLPSCSSVTKQSKRKNVILDVSQESDIEGTGASSADLRSMAERMAADIVRIEWPAGLMVVRIAITEIENETRFAINPNLLKDRLLTDLVEFSAKSKLQFTENKMGADYFLSVRITALSKGTSAGVSDYLQYAFRIVDRSDTLIWAKTYETKKQGQVGVMYR